MPGWGVPSHPAGSPVTLVCVPGLGLDERAWQPTLDALGGEALAVHEGRPTRRPGRVVLLPGYGVRPGPGDDLSPAALGVRLAGLLTGAAGPTGVRPADGPVLLAGHSASCQVVLRAAGALGPARVTGVVLVGPTTDPRARSWPALARRWTATAVRERPGQLPDLVRAYTRTGPGWMLRAMGVARRDDLRPLLPDLGCPVLVVRGPHDRICPAPWAEEVAGLAPPGSAAVTLRAGAHMVPRTHGSLLAEQVARWLSPGPAGPGPGSGAGPRRGAPPGGPRGRPGRWWRRPPSR